MTQVRTAAIQKCSVCGEKHESIELKAFANEQMAWTHWYTCPMSGEPGMVKMTVHKGTELEVLNDCVEALIAAQVSNGPMLVFVYHLADEKKKWFRRTVNFPRDKHKDVCETLLAELDEEQQLPEALPDKDIKLGELPPTATELFSGKS